VRKPPHFGLKSYVGMKTLALGAALLCAVAILNGCAPAQPRGPLSDADQKSCDELIRAVGRAMIFGSANISGETARFAVDRGLGVNLAPLGNGMYNLLPRAIPLALLGVAGDERGMKYLESRTAEERQRREDAAKRCEW